MNKAARTAAKMAALQDYNAAIRLPSEGDYTLFETCKAPVRSPYFPYLRRLLRVSSPGWLNCW